MDCLVGLHVATGKSGELFGLCSPRPSPWSGCLGFPLCRYAVGMPKSWAAGVGFALSSAGVRLPHEFGLGPGSNLCIWHDVTWTLREASRLLGYRPRWSETKGVATTLSWMAVRPVTVVSVAHAC